MRKEPTFEIEGLKVYLEQEDDNVNPYNEMDMLSEVVTWMRNYEFSSSGAYCQGLRNSGYGQKYKLYEGPDEIAEAVKKRELAAAWPLFAYMHSGITINLGEMEGWWPDKEWDCGLAGFAYVTMEKAKVEFSNLFDKNGRCKNRKKLQEECHRITQSEIGVLDQCLTGDVWYYTIQDAEGDFLDSCGGIYGYEEAKQMAREEATAIAKERAEKAMRKETSNPHTTQGDQTMKRPNAYSVAFTREALNEWKESKTDGSNS